jgi:hypothetical protein
VTASAGFEVSTNNVDFTPSVTLSTSGGTVHVRFAPASGTNQVSMAPSTLHHWVQLLRHSMFRVQKLEMLQAICYCLRILTTPHW